jgi:hypothetical protein
MFDDFRRYLKRARAAATITARDDHRRGDRQGQRRRSRAVQSATEDEHAQSAGFADIPHYVGVGRGYGDDLADAETPP